MLQCVGIRWIAPFLCTVLLVVLVGSAFAEEPQYNSLGEFVGDKMAQVSAAMSVAGVVYTKEREIEGRTSAHSFAAASWGFAMTYLTYEYFIIAPKAVGTVREWLSP